MFEALIAGAIAGLLWLDRFQLCQIFICRPIVSAPLTGMLLGNLSVGCVVGLMYELMWLRRPPVGGYIAPDSTLPSVSATAIAVPIVANSPLNILSVACLAFFATYPLTIIASRFDGIFRVLLGRLAVLAETAILEEGDKSVIPYMLAGLVLNFISAFFIAFTYTFVMSGAVVRAMQLIPVHFYSTLSIGFYAAMIIGVSDQLASFSKAGQAYLFVFGLILALTLCYLFGL